MQPQPQRYMPPQPGYGQPQGFPQPPGGVRPPGSAPVPPAGFRPPIQGGPPALGGPPGGLPGGPPAPGGLPGGLPGGPPAPGGLTAGVAAMNLGSPLMSPSFGGAPAGFKSPQVPPGPPGGPRTPLAGPPRPPGPPGPLHATQNGLHASPLPPPGAPGSHTNGGASPAMTSMHHRYPTAGVPGGPPSPMAPAMPAGSPRPPGHPLRPPGPPGAAPMPGASPHGMPPPMPGQAMPPQSPMMHPSAMPAAAMPGMPQSSMPGMRPPMPGMPQSPMPGMPPSSMPGMPPASMPGMPPAPMPGMPPTSMQGMPHSPMPGMPHAPMPGMPHAPMPGMPHSPMPGMPHAPMPGMPGPGAAPYPGGAPPMPGAYPAAGPGMQPRPGPGMGHPQPGMPGMPAGGQMAGPRKLDPDQMPSPIQVMADDQANRSGQFVTGVKGQVPPLTTTQFTVLDQGNVSPRLMRCSVYNVPVSPDMLKQTGIPLALSIAPLAELPDGESVPPVVDLGAMGPVRCIRCKAYMCPFMTFIDGGRRFSCPFCKASTEVPQEYFQHLDHTGQRLDKYERPELCMGAYEFVCTKEYCRNNEFPKPPAYIFIIDVSYNNVKSGLVHLLCNNMKEVLRQLPVDVGQSASNMKVGFITYSNVVHFFNCKPVLAQPQMLVVGDVQDMFVPLVDGLLVDAVEAEAVIDSLMEQLPDMFAATRETEVVLGPAIQAGMEALKAANCSGRLFVFHSSLPTGLAPGQLKNRDDRKVLGSDKEKHVLTPQTQFYNNLGQECVHVGCSVNLFLLNNSYVDLPTVGQVVRLTGGEIYKYTYFQADLDGDRLLRDLSRSVWQPIGFDAIMRVRTSTGIRPVDFHGHFFMSSTTDMELAAIDSSQAVTVELKHDDKLTEEDGVYVQAALLYTACSGQRRLRVLNLSLNVCSQMADLYRSCELDTMTNLMEKQAVSKVLDASPRAIRDSLTAQCAQILASYRKHCASPSSAGQLILPECMKLLPLYANCILRSDAVSGGPELTIDERSFHMFLSTSLPVGRSVAYLYPRLLPLDRLDPAEPAETLPAAVRSSQDKLHDQGLFLLENGVHMFLWIGLQLAADMVQELFGVQSVAQIDVDRPSLPNLDTPLSIRVRGVIEEVRQQRQSHMKLTVVRQRDKLEVVFRQFLVEDKGSDGSASYVDYLCHLHKEIRALLT